jgi:beta propeller repeat protein
MNPANLLNVYRRSLNPPYKEKDLITVWVTAFVLLIIPLTVIAALNSRPLSSRANTFQLVPGEQNISPVLPANNLQGSARISGDKVIFYNYDMDNCCDAHLILYDFTTKTSRVIATNTRGYRPAPLPSFSGNYIAWDDGNFIPGMSKTMDVWLYDVTTNTKRHLFNNPTYDETSPQVSGNKIVWFDERKGYYDVYLYDLSTGVEKQITNSMRDRSYLKFEGNRILWTDFTDRTVRLYDLTTNTERIIASRIATADISGNKIAYVASGFNGVRYTNEVYVHDLSTGTTRQITDTNPSSMKLAVDITGNLVTWIDYRDNPIDGQDPNIYLYNLATNRETRVTYADTGIQFDPTVSGNRVVWTDGRGEFANIYVYNIPAVPSPPPIVTLTYNPVEDATISRTQPTTNFGLQNYLVTDAAPKKTFLLKFNVTGVNGRAVKSVKLRFYCTDPSPLGGNVYLTSGNALWQEETVNWKTAPATPTKLASFGPVAAGKYYEVSLFPRIKGQGILSLAVSTTSSNGVVYSSKEAVSIQRPQLIYTVQ